MHLSWQQLGRSMIEFFHKAVTFLSAEAELTHPPGFFLITLTLFPCWTKTTYSTGTLWRATWEDVSTDWDVFVFPTGGSKEERCGRMNCEGPFLCVSHTMVCVSAVRWQRKSLCTWSPTQWHRETAGSDTGIILYHKLCWITYCRKSHWITLEMHQGCFRHSHYCNLIVWSDDASEKEQYAEYQCLALCPPFPSLPSISFSDCFSTHCVITLNQSGERDGNKDRTSLWIQQAALCTFVLVTVLSISVGNKTASYEANSQSTPDTTGFILNSHWRFLLLL